MAARVMLIENGNETFVFKNCMAEEQNSYYDKTLVIHIVYEKKLCNSRTQLKQRRENFFYIFENVCKKLDLHCIRSDTVKLVSYTWINASHCSRWAILFIDILK